jgi:DNA repair exonuclease SbcCD ATPase subunit
MAFLIPLEIVIPIGLVVVILIVVAWVIFFKNKKLYQKIKTEKQKISKYETRLEILKKLNSPTQKDFKKLSKIVRSFFKEYLDLDYNLTYLELEKHFKKQNKTNHAKFCRLMSDANYKGNKITSVQIKQLIDMFSKIMEDYK